MVCVATGVGTQGQGHFTVFAQVVADQLGVDPAHVRVVTGDTMEFHWGTGTFASRGAVVAGSGSIAGDFGEIALSPGDTFFVPNSVCELEYRGERLEIMTAEPPVLTA